MVRDTTHGATQKGGYKMSGGNVVNLYALRELGLSLLDAIDKYEDAIDKYEDATYSNLEGEVFPEHFREVERELGKAKVALNIVSIYVRCIKELVKGESGEEVFLEKPRGQIGALRLRDDYLRAIIAETSKIERDILLSLEGRPLC